MKRMITFLILLIIFSLFSCKKEPVINQIIVPNYSNDGEYVIEPLPDVLGNVKITIWPSFNGEESKIEIENRMDQPIAYIIRDKNDVAFVYFYDSYIKAKDESEKYGTILPFDEPLYIKIIVYKSTWSYLEIEAIESLGLDFWDNIADYRDKLKVEYEGELILEE
ncbi:hypothetical protein EOL94_00310 [bacterium]|nr:hypothetical protein [bacterium]